MRKACAILARNMDVYVVQILSAEEIDPPLTGDLKLMDVEDGDEAEVTVTAPLLKKYQETLANYRGKLASFARDAGSIIYSRATRCRSTDWCLAILASAAWCAMSNRVSIPGQKSPVRAAQEAQQSMWQRLSRCFLRGSDGSHFADFDSI